MIEAIRHVREAGGNIRTLWGKLFGQEKYLTTSPIARMNLFLHGVEAFQVIRGDTLRQPAFQTGDSLATFDCVIANPPVSLEKGAITFGAVILTHATLRVCLRPRTMYSWMQHMILSMAPKSGRMSVVMPHDALFHLAAEGKIREKLLGMDILVAVIRLGPNLFYGTGLAACILEFRQKKPNVPCKKLLIVDASKEFKKGRAQNEFLPEQVERIHQWYVGHKDFAGVARLVPLDEIQQNDWNLNILRYVKLIVEAEAVTLVRAIVKLKTSLEAAYAA